MPPTLSDSLPLELRAEWVQVLNIPKVPPRTTAKGHIDPEHYRARRAMLNMVAEAAVLRGEPLNKIDSLQRSLDDEIRLSGLDPKTIADARSDADKTLAAAHAMLEAPETIFDRTDEEIDLLAKSIQGAVELTDKIADERARASIGPHYDAAENARKLAEQKEERQRRGKAWLDRLQRVKRLRNLAKNPVPAKSSMGNITEPHVWRASHVLRWMAYVSRSATQSGRTTRGGREKSDVMQFGRHHARFALDTYEARMGIEYVNGRMYETDRKYKGVILIAPPGHTKTTFAAHYLALEIYERPKTQSMYVHAVVDEAIKGVAYVARLFDPEDVAGRRALSLIPCPRVRTHNAKKFELDLPEKLRSPTITPAGVMSAKLGADTSFQVLDDVVPASDVNEATTREERARLIAGTFATRQRGKGGFRLVIGTIWHQDDALSKMIASNKEAAKEGVRLYLVSRQFTGGPDTEPPFFALWEDEYNATELRKRFIEMGSNRALWSSNYQANPIADSQRIISRLRLYDPMSEEHAEYMASARFHISVDPTATNRETSDKAGLLYAGIGEVRTTMPNGESVYQPRLRILDAQEIHANPWELVDVIMAYMRSRPVSQVHIETRSNTHATADILENRVGVMAVRHDPKIVSKEVRLKNCAAIIDNSSATMPAIVEFPGTRIGDKVVPDERWVYFYKQILDFGFTEDDHLVDALTQLVNHFLHSGELVSGYGGFVPPPEKVEDNADPRIRKIIDEIFNKDKDEPCNNAWNEEHEWLMGADREPSWN